MMIITILTLSLQAWSIPPVSLQCSPSGHNPLLTKIQVAGAEAKPNLGFYKPDDVSVPPAIRTAANSVYQIVMPAGEKVVVGNILGPRHSLEDIVHYIGTLEMDRVERLALQYQVRACVKQPDPMKCEIFGGVITGSAYLTGDGSTLRTALHNVQDYARDHVKLLGEAHQKVDLPIFIFDRHGRPVVAPPTSTATGNISSEDLFDRTKANGGFAAPNHDGVEIKLSKTLGRPIPPATAVPQPGEKVYLVSYPQKTQDRAAYGVPDSPGFQLRVSQGTALSQPQVARRLGLAPEALTAQTRSFLSDLVASDVDGAPHSSGAALLNERGEFVGTYTAGNPADGRASPDRISYSSNLVK